MDPTLRALFKRYRVTLITAKSQPPLTVRKDLLPSPEQFYALSDRKAISVSDDTIHAILDQVLRHVRDPENPLVLDNIAKPSELSALGNVVLRSPHGAPVALALYRSAMEAGDDRGAFSYASMVYRGYRGTPKDTETGIRVFSELAQKGHPYAQMNLAAILMRTGGDVKKAIQLYELAGTAGITEAYTELGRIYRTGYGVHQNHAKAFEYFREGAQKGNPQCNFMLGVYHSSNILGCEDQEKAFKYFQKAAMRGKIKEC